MINESFVFYSSWYTNIIEEYDDKETALTLLNAIVIYGITGEKTFPCERLFLKQAYSQIDAAKAKHKARVEAGRKGGKKGTKDICLSNAKQNEICLSNAKQTQANDNVSVSDSDRDSDNNIINSKHVNNVNSLRGIALTATARERAEEYGRLSQEEEE